MLIIRLTPQLHQTVHEFKNASFKKNAGNIANNLSTAESSAVIKTFKQTNRKEISSRWF
ncbi:hypothetical protein Elgi_11820 [Paenibacillus elgii]|nr:hypothetical protein Elgi_11820 [Paenibacillus elgii]